MDEANSINIRSRFSFLPSPEAATGSLAAAFGDKLSAASEFNGCPTTAVPDRSAAAADEPSSAPSTAATATTVASTVSDAYAAATITEASWAFGPKVSQFNGLSA